MPGSQSPLGDPAHAPGLSNATGEQAPRMDPLSDHRRLLLPTAIMVLPTVLAFVPF